MELPPLPALFDEFGKGADDRVHDYVRARVAAAIAEEREANAALCESIGDGYQSREAFRWAEMKTDAQTGAHDCAAAIRARSTPRTQEG